MEERDILVLQCNCAAVRCCWEDHCTQLGAGLLENFGLFNGSWVAAENELLHRFLSTVQNSIQHLGDELSGRHIAGTDDITQLFADHGSSFSFTSDALFDIQMDEVVLRCKTLDHGVLDFIIVS